ncbi:hypothetical protein ACGFIY_30555 [Micromonospora chersina]|uniref:hypothetical protein n=1 Tax=Micromonospora chersina TaxID=47854 RepID=UPI003717709D
MDEARLDRARRISVAQTAGVIGVVLLLVGALMFVLISRQESRALDAGLATVLAAGEDVDDPPPGAGPGPAAPGTAAAEVTRSASPELVRTWIVRSGDPAGTGHGGGPGRGGGEHVRVRVGAPGRAAGRGGRDRH